MFCTVFINFHSYTEKHKCNNKNTKTPHRKRDELYDRREFIAMN